MFISHEARERFLDRQKLKAPMINIRVNFVDTGWRLTNRRADVITEDMIPQIDPADLQKFRTWQSLEGQRGRTS